MEEEGSVLVSPERDFSSRGALAAGRERRAAHFPELGSRPETRARAATRPRRRAATEGTTRRGRRRRSHRSARGASRIDPARRRVFRRASLGEAGEEALKNESGPLGANPAERATATARDALGEDLARARTYRVREFRRTARGLGG